MSKQLSGSIALTKLQHVLMEVEGQNGKVEGLFIPIKNNHLVKGKGDGVYLDVTVFVNDQEDQYGNIASIKQNSKIGGKKWSEHTDEEKAQVKAFPYLGNLKDFSGGGQNEASGNAGEGKKFSAGDSVPF